MHFYCSSCENICEWHHKIRVKKARQLQSWKECVLHIVSPLKTTYISCVRPVVSVTGYIKRVQTFVLAAITEWSKIRSSSHLSVWNPSDNHRWILDVFIMVGHSNICVLIRHASLARYSSHDDQSVPATLFHLSWQKINQPYPCPIYSHISSAICLLRADGFPGFKWILNSILELTRQ